MNENAENLKNNTDVNKTETNSTHDKNVEHKNIQDDKNVQEDRNKPEVKNVPEDKKVQERNGSEVKNIPEDKNIKDVKSVLEDKHVPEDKKVQEDRNGPEVKNAPEDTNLQDDRNVLEYKNVPEDKKVQEDRNVLEDKHVPEDKQVQQDRNVLEDKHVPQVKKVQDDKNALEENKIPGDKGVLEDKHVPEDTNVLEQEIEKNELRQDISPQSKKGKTNKFLNLFKNILEAYKAYSIKLKTIKEAKRLEKEKLKSIPKKVLTTKKNSEEQEWIIKQYEKYIKVPLYEPNPKYVFKKFKIKSMSRYVPEEKMLWIRSKPKPKDSIFLSWNGPPLKHCMCPYRECFCRGYSNLKSQSLPWQMRVDLNPFYFCQRMFNYPIKFETNKQFLNEMVATLAAEEDRYKKMSKGALAGMVPEICLWRCKHFFKAGENRNIRYLPIEFKNQLRGLVDDKKSKIFGDVEESKISEDVEEAKNSEYIEESKKSEDKTDKKAEPKQAEIKVEQDVRICNTYSCKVTTQTDTGPNGMLNIGKYSHVIFASTKDTFLPDIDGQKLHICPFEIESPVRDNQVYIRKMGNLLSVKELRSRLSKLISSIMEIREPGVPIPTRSTQIPSCNKVCDNFRARKYKRYRELDTPCVIKNNESVLEEIDRFSDIEDQSSCVCCKTFKESFNNNMDKK